MSIVNNKQALIDSLESRMNLLMRRDPIRNEKLCKKIARRLRMLKEN